MSTDRLRPATRSCGRPAGVRERRRTADRRARWKQLGAGRRRDPDVSWGSADFIAGEEIHRYRGYWWSPDGAAIAACRVDVAPVQRWYIGDPAARTSSRARSAIRRRARRNADVKLHVLALDGGSTEVTWDRDRFPYLAAVRWVVRRSLAADRAVARPARPAGAGGQSHHRRHRADLRRSRRHAGSSSCPVSPDQLDDGRLVTAADRDGPAAC